MFPAHCGKLPSMTATKARKQKRVSFREDIAYTAALSGPVDREAGVIRGLKVCGLESRNGRKYPLETLREALALYSNVPCNINHGNPEVNDRLGRWVNPRLEADGIYADLEYLKSHPMAERIIEAAERMPNVLGFSHNAEGDGEFFEGVWVVKKITEVRSVDLVADPATTNGLFEGRNMTVKEFLAKSEHGAALLNEMDGDPAGDLPMPDPAPEGGDYKMDLLAAIAKLLDSADVDTAKKVFALLTKAEGPAAPAEEAEGDSEDDAEEEPEDDKKSDATESIKRELSALKSDLAVRELCESLNFYPSPIQRKALAALEGDERAQLAESFSANTVGGKFRARSAPPVGLVKDVPTVEEAIKNGRYRD
jgi:hypothetical protein